jgi:hypothetical protein
MQRTLSPKQVIMSFTGLLVILSVASSAVGCRGPVFYLNDNQILYLFSTSAQVIAAIYGLTLTGFVFFRNELSREESEDETLIDAVDSLKKRYFSMMLYITGLALLAILLASLAISFEQAESLQLVAIVINTAQSAFITALLAIAYFVFDVIAPRRIEAASTTIKERLDPTRNELPKGDLEGFIRNYNHIEALLRDVAQNYAKYSEDHFLAKGTRRVPSARLAEILFRNDRIPESLFRRIRELVALRNSIIHGADPVVSAVLVENSAQVLQELKAALEKEI